MHSKGRGQYRPALHGQDELVDGWLVCGFGVKIVETVADAPKLWFSAADEKLLLLLARRLGQAVKKQIPRGEPAGMLSSKVKGNKDDYTIQAPRNDWRANKQ